MKLKLKFNGEMKAAKIDWNSWISQRIHSNYVGYLMNDYELSYSHSSAIIDFVLPSLLYSPPSFHIDAGIFYSPFFKVCRRVNVNNFTIARCSPSLCRRIVFQFFIYSRFWLILKAPIDNRIEMRVKTFSKDNFQWNLLLFFGWNIMMLRKLMFVFFDLLW